MFDTRHTEGTGPTFLTWYRQQSLAIRVMLFATCYLSLIQLAFLLTFPVTNFLTFWPPSGLFVAILLLSNRRDWPAMCLGAYASTTLLDALHGRNLLAGQCYIAGNCIEAVAGAWLIRRALGRTPTMDKLSDVISLASLSAVLGTALCATIGVTANVLLLGGEGFFGKWILWWSSNMLGVLVFAPFTLNLLTMPWTRHRAANARTMEFLTLVVLVLATSWIVAMHTPSWGDLSIVTVPVIIWAALRFGPLGASGIGAMLACTLVLMATVMKAGEAAATIPDIWPLQVFLAVSILVGLVLAAVLAEREAHRKALLVSENRLHHAEKMDAIGQLAGGVAHDFNNMLTAIIGNAELLQKSVSDPAIHRCAGDILQAAHRSADLTRKLLAFARKGKIRSVPVNLHALIEETIGLLTHSIDKRITVLRRLHANPPTFLGDPTQIQSALLNLALNARDAMPEGGVLTFATDAEVLTAADCDRLPYEVKPGPYVCVRVSDTGTGMDAEVRSHLFEPFFTTKPGSTGTGLGLASVYGTVRTHQGAIFVESAPQRGTTFKVLLPGHAASPDAAVTMPAVPASPGEARILLVDDEELVRSVAARMLRSLGYEVITCAGGAEAIAQYRRARDSIDLVILDLIMPDMPGRDVLRALREFDPAVNVIFASGYTMHRSTGTAPAEDEPVILQKPFRMEDLARGVANALEGRAAAGAATALRRSR